MIGIIPLAGPDFERSDGTVKSEYLVDEMPLLRRALESRPWWLCGFLQAKDLIFVLHDSEMSRRFASDRLSVWYSGCRVVFLSDYTAGAALSTASALGLIRKFDTPIVVDLCDILFDCDMALIQSFIAAPNIGGIAVTFLSDDQKYSYLEYDQHGCVNRCREKVVISNHASAGVYFFHSVGVLLSALSHSVRHADALSFNNLLYVCPLLNGVIAQGMTVMPIKANNVRDIKIL